MLLSVASNSQNKHTLFLLEPLAVNDKWSYRPIYSSLMQTTLPGIAWLTVASLPFPLALSPPDDHHTSPFLVSSSVLSTPVSPVSQNALSISSMLSSLPVCAISHQVCTCK
ncbi:hypothetical protein EON65_09700 [archaeon]|nr:MAG: hypothetical protein EON65_09700 [archaeon]